MKTVLINVKYILDRIIAACTLVLLAPVFFVVAIIVKSDSPGTVFFVQERAGLNGKNFMAIKFRTMQMGADKKTLGRFIQNSDPLVTRFGSFLRKSGIDELPQLVNVLRGEMSLIGPRPTLPYQVLRYSAHERRRLLMKPGLSGWAQVNGRNSLTWPERIEHDIWYIDNWSLLLDLRIAARTLLVLLRGEGATSSVTTDRLTKVDKE